MKYIYLYYNHFEETIADYIPKEEGYLEFVFHYYYGGSALYF